MKDSTKGTEQMFRSNIWVCCYHHADGSAAAAAVAAAIVPDLTGSV
jgi:hypothetical protein